MSVFLTFCFVFLCLSVCLISFYSKLRRCPIRLSPSPFGLVGVSGVFRASDVVRMFGVVHVSGVVRTSGVVHYTLFFYKNRVYKNINLRFAENLRTS